MEQELTQTLEESYVLDLLHLARYYTDTYVFTEFGTKYVLLFKIDNNYFEARAAFNRMCNKFRLFYGYTLEDQTIHLHLQFNHLFLEITP